MNKLIIDKATDKEKRIIREKMSCLLDELDEKDKKKIYFDNDDINIVRDIASDFFLVRVCGGFQMDMRDGITKFICYIMISEPTSKVRLSGLKDLILGIVKGMGLKGSIQFFKDMKASGTSLESKLKEVHQDFVQIAFDRTDALGVPCIVSTDGILKMKKYEHIGFEHVQDRKFKEKVYEHDLIRYPKNKNQEQR